MATPNYKGQGQPAASGGGWLSGLFGGTTPAYKSAAAQPAAASTQSANTTTANAATSATASASALGCDADGPTQFAIVIPRQVIETQ
jgi:hypothetical protein